MSETIRVEGLHFSYGQGEILKGVCAGFGGAGMHGVFGPNGSGKTTLLKCCTGILKPQRGAAELGGTNISALSCRERSRKIAYVPQEHRLSFPFTVEEVVLMGRTPHLGGLGNPSRADAERARQAIEEIGIGEIREKSYTQLSGGQRQLVLLARAVAQDTPVVILDEPTSALDFKNQLRVFEILRDMADSGRLVIACMHDPNHVKWFCEQVLVLKEGQVLEEGPVDQVLTQDCLEELYGSVCRMKNGMIVPRMCAQ